MSRFHFHFHCWDFYSCFSFLFLSFLHRSGHTNERHKKFHTKTSLNFPSVSLPRGERMSDDERAFLHLFAMVFVAKLHRSACFCFTTHSTRLTKNVEWGGEGGNMKYYYIQENMHRALIKSELYSLAHAPRILYVVHDAFCRVFCIAFR